MTLLADLLKSFLNSRPRWNASDVALARKILSRLRPAAVLEQLRKDPALIMEMAGLRPDPWQFQLLRSPAPRSLLLCCRQAGKSTTAAALALRVALLQPYSPVLLLSPSLRQSGELFRKVMSLFHTLHQPVGVVAATASRLELANGSRILSLPGTEGTVRGFSGVALLVIDEAARVADALYCSVSPMLAVSRGRLIALSTPYGKRGWFHDAWFSQEPWSRVEVPAPLCPRISAAYLAEERRAIGERWFRQEMLCSFEDTVESLFSHEDILASFDPSLKAHTLL